MGKTARDDRPKWGARYSRRGLALARWALGVALGLASSAKTARAGDPYLEWWTLETPHFHVHYHAGIEGIAQRTASIAEHVHHVLAPQLGWEPSTKTDIVISDDSDAANGSARTLPYNAVRLFVTAPSDMSVLGDYDDWQVGLVTHEYAHILHLDNATGLPALVNAILGKAVSPNQWQPDWITEGLATVMESQHTSAGRLRNTQFDMFLRADVLEKNLATIGEFSYGERRWPGGNMRYLYGSKFIAWILDTYGPDTFAQAATHYGRFVIPGGVNRAIRRVTGRTYEQLYVGWKASLEQRYERQAADIRRRGLREGSRITDAGELAASPRFVPRRCSESDAVELVYSRNDGRRRPGLYRVQNQPDGAWNARIVTRMTGTTSSFLPDCALVYHTPAPSRRKHDSFFNDLFRLPAGVTNASGSDRRVERLTIGERAREPDLSANGRRIAYVTNHAGTSTLRIADFTSDARIENARALVPSARFEQAYTPRFSPDGRRIAYSAWTRGGYRDIRVVDVETGTFFELMHDRAMDQQPSWSPDGKTLFFTSDRGGVANVHAYDFETAALRQVTNVINGAYMPEVSPDGRTLVYVGYTARGFDLYSMALDPSRFLEPAPILPRKDGSLSLEPERWPVARYNPLPSFRPRYYRLSYARDSQNSSFGISTSAFDAVSHHSLSANLRADSQRSTLRVDATYSYLGLPFRLDVTAFRNAEPRLDYQVGESPEGVTLQTLGMSTQVMMLTSDDFDRQSASVGFGVSHYSHEAPFGTRADPFSPRPSGPPRGTFSVARLRYNYSNAEGSAYSISPERGLSLALSADISDPAFGSAGQYAVFLGRAQAYLEPPWRRHHVLALSASGGLGYGASNFALGGFATQRIPAPYQEEQQEQRPLLVRGFAAASLQGPKYTLFNAEYRFPILYVDRGISTLPAVLRDISGALFADYGGAYASFDPDDPLEVMHLGVGAELWVDFGLAYWLDGNFRVGIAHGFDDQALSDFEGYFAISSAF